MPHQILLQQISSDELKSLIKEAVVKATTEILTNQKKKEIIYYSRHGVKELLSLHINTVDNLRKSGKLKFKRIGGSLRISSKDLEEYINSLES